MVLLRPGRNVSTQLIKKKDISYTMICPSITYVGLLALEI